MHTDTLFNKYYYDRNNFVGGTAAFHDLCRQVIPINSRILELGCGPSNPTSEYLATLGQLDGADISSEVLRNHFLRNAYVYDGFTIPVASATFSACVSDFVLEHVKDPDQHFIEVGRVLKPGGVYCFRTPNLLHYVSLAARLLPFSLHKAIANKIRGLPEDHHEPYKTYYRVNTSKTIRRFSRAAGLHVSQLLFIEPEPSYGKAYPLLFYPMCAYERLVNSVPLLARLRVNILAVLKKSPI